MNSDRMRAVSLEKDINFLQQIHKTTLEKLHEEIECLKRANKELQYQLMMVSHKLSKDSSAGVSLENHSQTGAISSEEKSGTSHSVEYSGGMITSLRPLKIHDGPTRPPRSPTLQECENIIRQLYNANVIPTQELLQVKSIFRESVVSKNLSNTTSEGFSHFPKIPQKPLPKIQQPTQANGREKVILPVIKLSLTDRQQRAKDIHKTRVRRTVYD